MTRGRRIEFTITGIDALKDALARAQEVMGKGRMAACPFEVTTPGGVALVVEDVPVQRARIEMRIRNAAREATAGLRELRR